MSVSTIGPLKDYATLQAWADAIYFSGTDESAECYSGSDLGELVIDNSFGDFTNLSLTIYVADGHQHNGTDAGTVGVAYCGGIFAVNPPPLVVRGLRGQLTGTGFEVYILGDSTPRTVTFEKNMLIVAGAALSTAAIYATANDSGGVDATLTATIRNNIIYQKTTSGTGTAAIEVYADKQDVATLSITATIANNSVLQSSGNLTYAYLLNRTGGTLTVTAKNNIALTTGAAGFVDGGAVLTASNNLSTDATGDDWGASGSLINQTAANVVENTATNATLKAASPAGDAGFDLSGQFTDDAIGVTRPQGSAWDMGALELLGGFGGGGGRRFFIEGGSQGCIIGA